MIINDVVALVVVRMGSSRLPGKALKPIMGKPMLLHLLERLGYSKRINRIVLTTTDRVEDDVIETLALENGWGCFRGSSEDVLDRIYQASRESGGDLTLQILGDNPLVHADLVDDIVGFFESGEYDYAVNASNEQVHADPAIGKFPIGIRVEAILPEALEQSTALTSDPYHREHATTFIRSNPELFRLGFFEASGKWAFLNDPDLYLAVNTQEDFDFIDGIFQHCYQSDPNFTLFDAMEFIR